MCPQSCPSKCESLGPIPAAPPHTRAHLCAPRFLWLTSVPIGDAVTLPLLPLVPSLPSFPVGVGISFFRVPGPPQVPKGLQLSFLQKQQGLG